MSAAWRRSCPRSVGPRRRLRSTRWRTASSCARAFPFIAGQRAFRFGHALVRDAAYAAMPLAARADAHERLAGWLVDLGDAVPDASARIGTQLERA